MVNLSTYNLSIGYTKKANKLIIQSGLNLELQAGELVCLIGPNGSGKSTLMRTLAGLQKPLVGKTLVGGKDISLLSQHDKALLISMVLTDKVDIENATVLDIVSIGRFPYTHWWGNMSEEDKNIIQKSIELVHLENKKDNFLNELSDGERQRVMIAMALAQDTPIIILDEPTAHLDLPNRVEIMLLLHKLAHQTRKGILLSTHELDLALQAGDRIWLMNVENGIECGVPEDLVFKGSFNRTFESKNYVFNASNGNFSMNYPMLKDVSVSGDKMRMYWTLRALARAGYQVIENSNIHITVNPNSWLISNHNINQEVFSVESLLQELSKL